MVNTNSGSRGLSQGPELWWMTGVITAEAEHLHHKEKIKLYLLDQILDLNPKQLTSSYFTVKKPLLLLVLGYEISNIHMVPVQQISEPPATHRSN